VVSNSASTNVTLSIPKDYRNYSTVTLAAGESRVYGTFVKPASAQNVGLRNVTPSVVPITPPRLLITRSGGRMQLQWASETGLQYQPQWTTNYSAWTALTNTFLAGTGSNMVCLDTLTVSLKGYRLAVRRP
jgi:hypothetical protein